MSCIYRSLGAKGLRISVQKEDREVGRTFLWLLTNELHEKPFGLVEDVFVEERFRGQGVGTELMEEVIRLARKEDCYKLILTSRYGKDPLHSWYQRLGFVQWGLEFRYYLS